MQVSIKLLSLLLGIVLCGSIPAQSSANFGAPKFAPPVGKKLLIMGQDLGAVGGLNQYTNGYVDRVDSPIPAGITSYTSIQNLNGLTRLANWGAGDVRAQAYLEDTDFQHSFIVIGLYMVGALEAVANGVHDQQISELANWIKGQNRPVFLRIGYEFEGPWNGYAPEAYKVAWRYLVHRFDEAEVTNVAYVWQSAGLNYSNIDQWYPGDEYVNWVGYSQFDGYNMGQRIKFFATQHDKPIMIAEATPKIDLGNGNGQSHWTNWYARVFNEIYANDRIQAFAYINADWDNQPMWTGQGWGDSRIQVNTIVKQNWEQEMENETWIHGQENLFDLLDYERWTITQTENKNPTPTTKLLINQQADHLVIRCKDHTQMQGLTIWTQGGQLLHRDSTPSLQYNYPLPPQQLGGLIISVETNQGTITQQVISGRL